MDGIRLSDHANANSVVGNVVQMAAGSGDTAGIHLVRTASQNQIIGNQASRLGENTGGFRGVVIEVEDCVDNVIADNISQTSSADANSVDLGTRTRINGLLQIDDAQERSNNLEPGSNRPRSGEGAGLRYDGREARAVVVTFFTAGAFISAAARGSR